VNSLRPWSIIDLTCYACDGCGCFQARQVAREEKQRALRVVGVRDINKRLDLATNNALDPVDNDLGDLRSTLDRHQQNNVQLMVSRHFADLT